MTSLAATAPPAARRAPAHGMAVRGAVWVVDGGVVAFAWFTILAQLWDIANGPVDPLLILWLATAPVLVFAVTRLRARADTAADRSPAWARSLARRPPPTRAAIAALAVLVGAGAALLATTHRSDWVVGWALTTAAVLATLVGLLVVKRPATAPAASADQAYEDPVHDQGYRRAVAWALALALVAGMGLILISLFTIAPTWDDAYYVNRVTWIGAHGTIPDRDTMFGNNVFPPLYTPAIGTFETFAGAIAHLSGTAGAVIDYLVLGPLLVGAVPLVLWRSMLAFRFRRPVLGLIAVLAFLLFTFRGQAWFGLYVLLRPWLTKAIFAGAMIPLLYAYGSIVGRNRGWLPGILLVAGTIASVGLTASAAALAPVVLVAIGVAGYLFSGPRVLVPVLLALAYPATCLIAYRFGSSSHAFSATGTAHYTVPYDIWTWFVGTGVVGVTVGAALAVGFLGAREPMARFALGIGCLGMLIALAPGLLERVGPLLGGAPTAWRVIWVAPLPLLVAGAVSAVDALGGRMGGAVARYGAPSATVLLVAMLAVFETPITTAPDTTFARGPRWDVQPGALTAARRLVDLAPAGAVVGGPASVAFAVGITSATRYSLDERSYYGRLIAADAGPAMRMADRIRLTQWLSGWSSTLSPAAAAAELGAWPVDAVCLARTEEAWRSAQRSRALLGNGYVAAGQDRNCDYFKLTGANHPGAR